MSTRFLLVRHGMCDPVGKSIAGRAPAVHLNETGRQEVQRLASGLSGSGLTAIYSSPLERARQTADAISVATNVAVRITEALNELDFGEWTGRKLAELDGVREWQTYNAFRSGTRIPGGESMLDVQHRIVSELGRLRLEHPDATVAIVSHGDVLRAALTFYLGMPLDFYARIEVDPASYSILELGEAHARVTCMNALGKHLTP